MKYSFLASLLALPSALAFASPSDVAAAEAASFIATLNSVFLFPLLTLLTAVAFLVFSWGAFMYLVNADNEVARQQGVSSMTYGIIGLVVMASAFAILAIFANTFSLGTELDCAVDPSAGGCSGLYST